MPTDSSVLETQAVEVERVLNQLQRQIDRYRTLPPIWCVSQASPTTESLLALRPRQLRLRHAS
jgi:hypothetical protein